MNGRRPVPDLGVAMVMLGVGGVLLLGWAGYRDYLDWQKRKRQ